jgi:cell division protein FtsI/penicillin-binding protein 2
MVGKDGVEMTMNPALNGIRGWVQTEIDVKKHELAAYRKMDVAARSGANVVLTLDVELQHILETSLADAMQKHTPISASAIMIRPQTGEVLAMATLPNYDPNNPGAYPADSRRNRLITDLAEPGSTFKIVVVTAALNERVVTLNDLFDCERGKFVFYGKPLRDAHEGYGILSVENIIAKSSNIGAAKIGIRLGQARLFDYIRIFGFGDRTCISLPGERLGTVHPLKAWNKFSISRIPMGHEVTVTPLQIIMAMSALANQGRLMRPLLIDRLEDDGGHTIVKYRPEMVRQVCTEATAKLMVKALQNVATTNGTALEAHLDYYQVAGKTGTAQKATAEGYMPGKYFSSFIGFFPAERPELCIGVFLDEPRHGYYGGRTAAPFFKTMGERAASYLSIRPDNLTETALAQTPDLKTPTTPRPN